MNTRTLTLCAAFALLGCDDDPAPAPPRVDARVEVGADVTDDAPSDVGSDAASDATRTLVRRGLLAGAVDSLLVDPFVTGDTSWGHFYAFVLDGSRQTAQTLVRSIESDAPAGVTAPVVRVEGGRPGGDQPELHLLTFVSGSATPVTATLWVSVRDASGAHSAFEAHASGLRVALFANAGLPMSVASQMTMQTPLEADGRVMRQADGRVWTRLATRAPVAFTQGGYLSITVTDLASAWRFTAPEVTHNTTMALGPRRAAVMRPLEDHDRVAMRAYAAHAEEVAGRR